MTAGVIPYLSDSDKSSREVHGQSRTRGNKADVLSSWPGAHGPPTDLLIFSCSESGSTPFTQHSAQHRQPSEISLGPENNESQIKEQMLVPELDHQEKFRLYLQVFTKLGSSELCCRARGRYSSFCKRVSEALPVPESCAAGSVHSS